MNLLINAIRYSPEQALIKVALQQEENNAVIKVADEEEGILDKYKDKIFQRDFRINYDKKGSGIGLSGKRNNSGS